MRKVLYICSIFSMAMSFCLGGQNLSLTVAGAGYPLITQGLGAKKIKVMMVATESFGSIELEGVLMPYLSGDAPIAAKTITSVIGNGKGREAFLDFEIKSLGYYDLTVKAYDRKKTLLAEAKATFSAIPVANYDRPKDWGVCTHYGQGAGVLPLNLDLLKAAGFSMIRDELFWGAMEKEKGKFAVPKEFQAYIDAAVNRKITPLIILSYVNPLYVDIMGGKPFPCTPEGRQAFLRNVEFTVKHFKNQVKYWEIWNEPNHVDPVKEYLPLLKETYPLIHRIDPGATVISCGGAGAGGGPGGGYIIPILNAKGVDYQDGFSIHPYMGPNVPEKGYSATGAPIPAVNIPMVWEYLGGVIKGNLRSDRRKLTMWVTELGWTTGKCPQGLDEKMQAVCLSHAYLLNRRYLTAKGLFWYDFQNDGENPNEQEHNFGLIRKNFSPKPSYQTAAVLASVLQNRPFIKAWRDDDAKIYEYGKKNDSAIAVWTVEKPQTIKVKIPYLQQVKVIDWQGKESMRKVEQGDLALEADLLPQYIILKY